MTADCLDFNQYKRPSVGKQCTGYRFSSQKPPATFKRKQTCLTSGYVFYFQPRIFSYIQDVSGRNSLLVLCWHTRRCRHAERMLKWRNFGQERISEVGWNRDEECWGEICLFFFSFVLFVFSSILHKKKTLSAKYMTIRMEPENSTLNKHM